jgi:hypothetical protein
MTNVDGVPMDYKTLNIRQLHIKIKVTLLNSQRMSLGMMIYFR